MANPIALGESDVGPPGGTKDNVARIPRRLLLRHPVPVLFEAIKKLGRPKTRLLSADLQVGEAPGRVVLLAFWVFVFDGLGRYEITSTLYPV